MVFLSLQNAQKRLLFEVQFSKVGSGAQGAQASSPTSQEAPAHLALTLHVPRPPDGVIEPDLVSPLELQALEILPLWRYQLPTEKQERGKLIGSSENEVTSESATGSFQAPKFWINPLQVTGEIDRIYKSLWDFSQVTWSRGVGNDGHELLTVEAG